MEYCASDCPCNFCPYVEDGRRTHVKCRNCIAYEEYLEECDIAYMDPMLDDGDF